MGDFLLRPDGRTWTQDWNVAKSLGTWNSSFSLIAHANAITNKQLPCIIAATYDWSLTKITILQIELARTTVTKAIHARYASLKASVTRACANEVALWNEVKARALDALLTPTENALLIRHARKMANYQTARITMNLVFHIVNLLTWFNQRHNS